MNHFAKKNRTSQQPLRRKDDYFLGGIRLVHNQTSLEQLNPAREQYVPLTHLDKVKLANHLDEF